MNIPAKKNLIPLAFAFNIALTLYGFIILLESPYTGLRMSVCQERACVKSVDRDSPAWGKIQPGDTVVDVNGTKAPSLVFHEDPDYIRQERDFNTFWEAASALHDSVVKGRAADISLERGGGASTVSLIPVQFPLNRALLRTVPIYIVGWTFLVVAYLVYRKKANEASGVFLLMGTAACIDWAAGAPFTVRDIAFDFPAFRVLNRIDLMSALVLVCSFLHLALVFPRRITNHSLLPRMAAGLYAVALLLVALRFMQGIDNTYLSTYIPFTVCILSAAVVYVVQYFREKNGLVRRQIKWVVLCMVVCFATYSGLSAIPIVLGSQFVSVDISGLITIFIPLSFAFAITKYRLMEIENILDKAVIYGFTIVALAGIEMAFLSAASPYFLKNGKGLPSFSVITVLLIVFIYVPVRDFIRGLVERIFKRGRYDVEKELQRFTISLGLCDERSALEKYSSFIQELLKPTGTVVVKIQDQAASLLFADTERARALSAVVLTNAQPLWRRLRNKGACMIGYELSDRIAGGASVPLELEQALFAPFIVDSVENRNGYVAVLLGKWNETAYTAKDMALLNAISVNLANIIDAGELRRERAELDATFRKEKDYVIKELHDGLGTILTSVAVASQAAEKLLDADREKARELVGRIGDYSTEAMDFMRTGLTVLDNPRGEIGPALEWVKNRFSDMFDATGTELRVRYSDETAKMKPGAVIVLNLIRIIQEALTNIMKHAGATIAGITIERNEGGLAISITDDGRGFVPGAKTAGFGLMNMARRIESMNGVLEITSSTGNGTKLKFTIPRAGDGTEGHATHAPGDR